MIQINEEKCNVCGICSRICPMGVLEIDSTKVKPVLSVVASMEKACFSCGHCEAGCPQGAISVLDNLKGEKIVLHKDLRISPAQIGQHLRGRRSIRHFKEEPVDTDILKELMDIARFAPTALNLQPLHWSVISGREKVHTLSALVIERIKYQLETNEEVLPYYKKFIEAWENDEDLILRSAPHLVIVHAHKDSRFASMDAIIALTYMEVAAPAYGVGMCLAGGFQLAALHSEALLKALALPQEHVILGAMMVGYPRHQYLYIPRRKEASVEWR